MEWALVFILTYTDPAAPQYEAGYNEHATVTSTFFSQAECETAGSIKMSNIAWTEADGGQLKWICTQSARYAQQ